MCELSINKAFKNTACLTTKQKQATEAPRLNILAEQIVNVSETYVSCKRERIEQALLKYADSRSYFDDVYDNCENYS